ncbi:MAG: glycosyltransferase [Butyrivibrio sp.]|nr:glycosyltransferase [Butyrivibrio sp.]
MPATMGGAVEELITRIVSDNEIQEELSIDLFSIYDDNDENDQLRRTRVISVYYNNTQRLMDRFLDKAHRTVEGSEGYRLFDKNIAEAFEERLLDLDEPYDAVIVENQVSIARKIVDISRKAYEFPIFFHMHNDVDIYRSPKGLRELASKGVQFIAVSKYIKSQILRYAGEAVVHVLYNGTEVAGDFAELEEKKTDKVRFLYAGRIIPEKGVLELVEAYDKLLVLAGSEIRSRISLDIIGFSSNQTKYEKQVRNLAGKQDGINCKRRISTSDMSRKYNDYDVVVMPTMNEEPFGLVALETMSRGLPLITTNSGALPEVVGDGALIVEKSGDFTTKLADAMLRLASDKDLRNELGKRAYARARDVADFDIKNYYGGFVRIIDVAGHNDKISIVVPIFNVSHYLEKCVNSLLEQTYTNIEVLLIDDGSTDNSGELCDSFAKRDSRVKVIHQANQGLSGARNTGLDNATGEYVFFCDSDDFLQKDALVSMYDRLCRDNADIVACGISCVWDDYDESGREELFTNSTPGTFSGREAVKQMTITNNICTVAWNKLYRRSLFENIRFPVGALHEDEATVYKLLYEARIVAYTPDPYYKYYQRTAGIMGGSLGNRGGYLITALTDRIKFFEEKNDTELIEYSRIALLERIKYIYRNVTDKQDRKELAKVYGENITFKSAPVVAGVKKRLALLLWKYIKY